MVTLTGSSLLRRYFHTRRPSLLRWGQYLTTCMMVETMAAGHTHTHTHTPCIFHRICSLPLGSTWMSSCPCGYEPDHKNTVTSSLSLPPSLPYNTDGFPIPPVAGLRTLLTIDGSSTVLCHSPVGWGGEVSRGRVRGGGVEGGRGRLAGS